MNRDQIALDTAKRIEAILAEPQKGGAVQRRAKIQCAVLAAIARAAGERPCD